FDILWAFHVLRQKHRRQGLDLSGGVSEQLIAAALPIPQRHAALVSGDSAAVAACRAHASPFDTPARRRGIFQFASRAEAASSTALAIAAGSTPAATPIAAICFWRSATCFWRLAIA